MGFKSVVPYEAGYFYSLSAGHCILFEDSKPGIFELGNKFQLDSMFEMWELLRNSNHVGFYFYSGFTVDNKGGFIITFMEAKRGKAKESVLSIRHPDIMLFSYPSCGAIAVSTRVSDHMKSILLEQ